MIKYKNKEGDCVSLFNIHFFKEKSRKIDLDNLVYFFENIEGMTMETNNSEVRFDYLHPMLNYQASFVITPKSHVPDIHRLNPRFLDLNFRLEMPILTPDYAAKKFFEIVRRVCDQFEFHIYNEMFENVLPYKAEVVHKVFDMLKEAYVQKNPVLLRDYHILPKEKLNSILRYLDDLYELQKYYKELDTYVPRYLFLKDEEKRLFIGIEWKELTLTVFPPYLDYVFYRVGEQIRIVAYEDVLEAIEKHLLDVPGFIKGTKVISKKLNKRIYRIMKKTKFTNVEKTFTKELCKHLLD